METIDFLPERVRARRARSRRFVRHGYLLVLAAGVLALLAYVRQGRIAEAADQIALLASRANDVQQQLDVRSSLERQMADLMITERIDRQLGSRTSALDMLGELSQLLPRSVALRELRLEAVELRQAVEPVSKAHQSPRAAKAALAPHERTVNRMKMSVVGLAPTDMDVANFVGQLSASALFEDVNIGYTKNVPFRGRTAREFQASCYVAR